MPITNSLCLTIKQKLLENVIISLARNNHYGDQFYFVQDIILNRPHQVIGSNDTYTDYFVVSILDYRQKM